jgi:capsular polysaccharide export protein
MHDNYYKQLVLKKDILLLQGPVGPFFKHFADYLISKGASVFKINFHYGEQFFFKSKESTLYRGSVEEWHNYLIKILHQKQIKQVFMIGKHKIYHQIAVELCNKLNIQVFVFEEGYIRSGYITIEENGVNGDTSLPKDPNIYFQWNNQGYLEPPESTTLNIAARYFNHWKYYYLYSWGLFISQWLIPNYRHHLPAKGWRNFFKWNKFFWKLPFVTLFPFAKEKNSLWTYRNINKYYIAILQINTDSAVTQYSQYAHMEEFIHDTIKSFADNAPKDTKLMIKHHPFDRGIHCYKAYIENLTQQYGIKDRVLYLIDIHLNMAFENSRGCLVINSTAGFAALSHQIPTIALSPQAIYNLPGLTNQCSLDEFWRKNEAPDQVLLAKFRSYLVYHTQMRGCFYGGVICDFHRKFIFEE